MQLSYFIPLKNVEAILPIDFYVSVLTAYLRSLTNTLRHIFPEESPAKLAKVKILFINKRQLSYFLQKPEIQNPEYTTIIYPVDLSRCFIALSRHSLYSAERRKPHHFNKLEPEIKLPFKLIQVKKL